MKKTLFNIITLIGLITGIVYSGYEFLKEKSLTISLDSQIPLIKESDISEQVSIKLGSIDIRNLHILVYTIKNTGSFALTYKDFSAGPIIINLGSKTNPIKFLYSSNNRIPIKYKFTSNTVELTFDLLNPDEAINFQILTTGANPNPNTYARLTDTRISHNLPTYNFNTWFSIGMALAFSLTMTIIIFSYAQFKAGKKAFFDVKFVYYIGILNALSIKFQYIQEVTKYLFNGNQLYFIFIFALMSLLSFAIILLIEKSRNMEYELLAAHEIDKKASKKKRSPKA